MNIEYVLWNTYHIMIEVTFASIRGPKLLVHTVILQKLFDYFYLVYILIIGIRTVTSTKHFRIIMRYY